MAKKTNKTDADELWKTRESYNKGMINAYIKTINRQTVRDIHSGKIGFESIGDFVNQSLNKLREENNVNRTIG